MKNPKIAIIDYGLSNLYSISKAVNLFTNSSFIIDEPSGLLSADAAILPGVGAFQEGMNGLYRRGLINPFKEFALSGKPVLGICLGAQLMLSSGFEFGVFEGLALMPGKVVKFPKEVKEKVPHMGWNKIYPPNNVSWEKTAFNFSKKNPDMYFVHSYVLEPQNNKNIFSLSNYGGYEFCSAIREKNIYGCQFHPEKSGGYGLDIIKNFIKIIGNDKEAGQTAGGSAKGGKILY